MSIWRLDFFGASGSHEVMSEVSSLRSIVLSIRRSSNRNNIVCLLLRKLMPAVRMILSQMAFSGVAMSAVCSFVSWTF